MENYANNDKKVSQNQKVLWGVVAVAVVSLIFGLFMFLKYHNAASTPSTNGAYPSGGQAPGMMRGVPNGSGAIAPGASCGAETRGPCD